MANQQLKNREAIGSAVDKELLTQLRQYSKVTGIPISRLLDRAITLLLESVKSNG